MTDDQNEPAPGIELRPVGPEDETFLFQVHASARERDLSLTGWNDQQKNLFLQHQFAAQNNHYQRYFPNSAHQIIMLANLRVGRLWVDRKSDEIRILDLIVLPAHRRKGIGTKLLEELQDEANGTAKPLRITLEMNNPALAQFQRFGFAITGENGPHYLLEWRPHLEAEK
jgi:ribosomal protein S18 acetylase RimI-like enzyme